MKLLITGGAGFIGANFIHWLLNNQSHVSIVCLDALTYAGNLANLDLALKNYPERLMFIKGNICDASLTEKLISEADAVLNFAAESHVDRSIDGPKIFIETNINGTFNLLEKVKKLKPKIRFVQISTDEVYGSLGESGKFTEETPLAPNSPYSASKASADLLVRAYHHTFNLDTIITRCSNNYGPLQFPEKLIPLMVSNALSEKKLPVYGNGMNVRDWIYVEDHCAGIWQAFTKGKSGEVYNFGGESEYPNIEIVKQILKILKKSESLIEFVKDRPGHDFRYAMDNTKSRRELDWSPKVSFSEGLYKTIDWYLKNQKWVETVNSGEYKSFYERWYNR